jgi:hypothetical protein
LGCYALLNPRPEIREIKTRDFLVERVIQRLVGAFEQLHPVGTRWTIGDLRSRFVTPSLGKLVVVHKRNEL